MQCNYFIESLNKQHVLPKPIINKNPDVPNEVGILRLCMIPVAETLQSLASDPPEVVQSLSPETTTGRDVIDISISASNGRHDVSLCKAVVISSNGLVTSPAATTPSCRMDSTPLALPASYSVLPLQRRNRSEAAAAIRWPQ